jgi:hypothetical protein
MPNQELINVIKHQLEQGRTEDTIKTVLISQGHKEEDIEAALRAIYLGEEKPPEIEVPERKIEAPSITPPPISQIVQPPKRPRKILLFVILLIGLLIIGGGASAYFFYWQSPEMIMQRMFGKLGMIKSAEYSGQIKFETEIKGLFADPIGVLLNFDGAFDITNLDNPKQSQKINASGSGFFEGLALELGVKTIDKINYVKLSNIAPMTADLLTGLGLDLTKAENQWIKIDIEEAKERFGVSKKKTAIEKLRKEQILKAQALVKKFKLFKITQKMPSEKIEGVISHHYKFALDKEEFKMFILEMEKILGEDFLFSEEEISRLDDALALFSLTGDIWIGKSDLWPYKIILDSSSKEDEEKGMAAAKITLNLSFKNFNKTISIEPPAEAKSLQGVMGGVGAGEIFAHARDSQRVSDLTTLRSAISLYLMTVEGVVPWSELCDKYYWGTILGAKEFFVGAPR